MTWIDIQASHEYAVATNVIRYIWMHQGLGQANKPRAEVAISVHHLPEIWQSQVDFI
jgi:hypothetical protein